ncbi:hypothetical protein M1413_04115 [Patescibacteria group bacterium]|nr:hypothetical protein [Patescibacteria group bacterium]MCL5114888.1 hypothetical protein [Patescibacteria group bacterium]
MRLWLFLGIFLGLLVVGIGIYFLQNRIQEAVVTPLENISSPEEQATAVAKIQKWIADYEAEMRADTVGGKTPEETLQLFIDALRKGDVELAAEYILLDPKDPNLREEWRASIEKKKSEGKLNKIADALSKSVYDASSSDADVAWFSVLNESGAVDYSTILEFNKYSGIWKIKGM